MNKSQTPETDRQILFSLERISEAFRVLLWEQSKETGLSPIQIQILLFISSHEPQKCRITYLAQEFNLTKATVSDSVKVLINKGYLSKVANSADTRSFSLSLTELGVLVIKQVSGFTDVFNTVMLQFSTNEKYNFYSILHRLIKGLNISGVISVQRNCSSCRFYRSVNGNHFCELLKTPLRDYELRADCAEHET